MSSQLPLECEVIINMINMIILTNIAFLREKFEILGSISQNLVFLNGKVMPSYKIYFIYFCLNYETI
jgi:hypothetical protein